MGDSESMRALLCIALEQNIKTQMWMAASMVPQEFWETYEEKKVEFEQHMEDYKRFKSERDSAAFEVLDVNGDGTLGLEGLLAIFDPNGSKQKDFLVALGFMAEKDRTCDQLMGRFSTGAICAQQ